MVHEPPSRVKITAKSTGMGQGLCGGSGGCGGMQPSRLVVVQDPVRLVDHVRRCTGVGGWTPAHPGKHVPDLAGRLLINKTQLFTVCLFVVTAVGEKGGLHPVSKRGPAANRVLGPPVVLESDAWSSQSRLLGGWSKSVQGPSCSTGTREPQEGRKRALLQVGPWRNQPSGPARRQASPLLPM